MHGTFVGALSGTSVDGIDAALVTFSPEPKLVATHTVKFPAELRAELIALAVPGPGEIDRLGAADVRLGALFAQAVLELLKSAGVAPSQVRAIGSHGQTIRHRPEGAAPFTLQVGDPNTIATLTGIPVVADFRRKDMAVGGQGAPLVPAFHEVLFRHPTQNRVIVNIGGIANITVLPSGAGKPACGFDTGPGNTLMDGWSRRVLNEPMDRGGAFAARGKVVTDLMASFLADPFFRRPPPKSTGPEYFSMTWLQGHLAKVGEQAPADVQATLLTLTARSIADAITQIFPGAEQPDVYICGGGARNERLMAALRAHLPGAAIGRTDDVGVPGDWLEAMTFAWLASRRMEGKTGNSPATTGARRAAVLGGVWLPG